MTLAADGRPGRRGRHAVRLAAVTAPDLAAGHEFIIPALSSRPPASLVSAAGLPDELRQVECLAQPLDQPQLGYQVIDMTFFVGQNRLEDIGAGDV
jgi:hypothetical protein